MAAVMPRCLRCTFLFAIFLLSVLVFPVVAQQSMISAGDDQAPSQLPRGIGSVVAALNGLVKSTNDFVSLGRASQRLQLVRRSLTASLLASNSDGVGFTKLTLSPEAVLCGVRGDYAIAIANRSLVSTVSSTIQTTATPSKIDSFASAIGSLFQGYSFSVEGKKNSQEAKRDIEQRCRLEVYNYSKAYYGMPIAAGAASPNASPEEAGILDFVSPASALLGALGAIITPMVTNLASVVDENRRIEAIASYFSSKQHRDLVSNAARQVAATADEFARNNRMIAIGHFSEAFAIIRNGVEPSKVEECKTGLKERVIQVPDPAKPGDTVATPSDAFILCYEKLWRSLADATTGLLKSADDYDQFADATASSATAQATNIAKYLDAIENPDPPTLKDIVASSVKLIAFADTVSRALSPENQAKLKSAIAALVNVK
jgi:hypothetical protein